jgi:hypothetical protein
VAPAADTVKTSSSSLTPSGGRRRADGAEVNAGQDAADPPGKRRLTKVGALPKVGGRL